MILEKLLEILRFKKNDKITICKKYTDLILSQYNFIKNDTVYIICLYENNCYGLYHFEKNIKVNHIKVYNNLFLYENLIKELETIFKTELRKYKIKQLCIT